MSLTVNIGEAKTRLSELLAKVEAGEEVIIARGADPIARLTPHSSRGGFCGADRRGQGGAGGPGQDDARRTSRLARRRAAFLMAFVVDASMAAAGSCPTSATRRPTA